MIKKVGCFLLELTNICNLNCDFCANRLMTREKGAMDLGLAKRLVKEVKESAFSSIVTTNLMGEPLLYKDLFALLEYIKALKQKTNLITNAEALDEDTSSRLLIYPPDEISISYHSHNDASYKHKNSSSTYRQYQKKIMHLVEQKFKLKAKTRINLNMISTFNKAHDGFRILDSQADLSLFRRDWLDFACTLKKKYNISWNTPDSIYPGANMLLPDFYICLYFDYHLWQNRVLPLGTKVIPQKKHFCSWPFTQFNVLWNGDLTLCCRDYNGELVYDNIRKKSIIEAFNSDKINRIRNNFLNGNLPQVCAVCAGRVIKRDNSDYGKVDAPYRIMGRDNFKRRLFRAERFLWKAANLKVDYPQLLLQSKIAMKLRKLYWSACYKDK